MSAAFPSVEYDDARHEYRLDGRLIPHVTRILEGLNLYETRWFTEESRQRGTFIHKAIEFYLDGDLDFASVPDELRGYVDAAAFFVSDLRMKDVTSELVVVHARAPIFGGRLDLLARPESWPDAAVWDFKSGASGSVAGMQTAGYDLAIGGKRRRRHTVELRKDGTYRIREWTDPNDYTRFLSAADLYSRFIFGKGHDVA